MEHTAEDERQDRERADRRVERLVQSGLTRENARMCDDLATHASHKAVDAMMTVCRTAPESSQIIVQVLAMKMLMETFKISIQDHVAIVAMMNVGIPFDTAYKLAQKERNYHG